MRTRKKKYNSKAVYTPPHYEDEYYEGGRSYGGGHGSYYGGSYYGGGSSYYERKKVTAFPRPTKDPTYCDVEDAVEFLKPYVQRELLPVPLVCSVDFWTETANWRYDGVCHQMRVSSTAAKLSQRVKGGESLGIVRELLRHETLHALYTERDREEVENMLKRIQAVFPHFRFLIANVFEDCRIEAAGRAGKSGVIIDPDMLKYEYTLSEKAAQFFGGGDAAKVPASLPTPGAESMLLNATVTRGDAAERAWICGHVKDGAKAYAYYDRICAADSTLALEPILMDWMKEEWEQTELDSMMKSFLEFLAKLKGAAEHRAADETEECDGGVLGGDGGGEDTELKSKSRGKYKYKKTEDDETSGEGDLSHVPASEVTRRGGTTKFQHYAADGKGTLHYPCLWKETADAGEKVAAVLGASLKVGTVDAHRRSPSGRLDTRRVIAGLPNVFRHTDTSGSIGVPRVRLIIDASGSMAEPILEAQLGAIPYGLAVLAQRRIIELDTWISSEAGASHLPVFLPAMVRGIKFEGNAERIARTLAIAGAKEPHKAFDSLIVLTDGQITDYSVAAADFGGMVGRSMAVYVPESFPVEEDIMFRMRHQFPTSLVHPNPLELAAAMARKFKEQSALRRMKS